MASERGVSVYLSGGADMQEELPEALMKMVQWQGWKL